MNEPKSIGAWGMTSLHRQSEPHFYTACSVVPWAVHERFPLWKRTWGLAFLPTLLPCRATWKSRRQSTKLACSAEVQQYSKALATCSSCQAKLMSQEQIIANTQKRTCLVTDASQRGKSRDTQKPSCRFTLHKPSRRFLMQGVDYLERLLGESAERHERHSQDLESALSLNYRIEIWE